MVYMGLTGGLYCVSVGGWCRVGVGVEWWLRPLFFYGVSEFLYCEIIPYNDYLVYLQKQNE